MLQMYPVEIQNSINTSKLNKVRSLSSISINKVFLEPSLNISHRLFVATNDYILQCVSVLMETPIKQIETQKKTIKACNARMVCWFILKQRSGMSYRQIANLYNANVSMVHRAIKLMSYYYDKGVYSDYNMFIDLTNKALDEKLLITYYENTTIQYKAS